MAISQDIVEYATDYAHSVTGDDAAHGPQDLVPQIRHQKVRHHASQNDEQRKEREQEVVGQARRHEKGVVVIQVIEAVLQAPAKLSNGHDSRDSRLFRRLLLRWCWGRAVCICDSRPGSASNNYQSQKATSS